MTKMEKRCTNYLITLYAEENGKLEKQNQRKTSKNKKNYLKCASKPSYMLH